MKPFKGSCLCKAVTYEIDALSGPVGHCHCHTCQKAHAAAFATTVRVSRDKFRWLSGENKLSAYESTPGKHRTFCSICGSQLIAAWRDRDEVILRFATLDTYPDAQPAAHIWMSHKASWIIINDGLPALPEGSPPVTKGDK